MSTEDFREFSDDDSGTGECPELERLFEQIAAVTPPAESARQLQNSMFKTIQTLPLMAEEELASPAVTVQRTDPAIARRLAVMIGGIVVAVCCLVIAGFASFMNDAAKSASQNEVIVETESSSSRENSDAAGPGIERSSEYIPVTLSPGYARFASELINGGFEDSAGGPQPVGWIVPPVILESGYQVQLKSDAAFEGKSYAVLSCSVPPQSSQVFGNMMQVIDAIAWEGKRVRFSAAVKTANLGAESNGRLWLRVDGEPSNGIPVMLAFDNMEDRPIKGGEWARYEIVADVPKNAKSILVGALLIGSGEVSIDDVVLEEVEGSTSRTTAGSPMSGNLGVTRGADPPQSFWTPWLLAVAVCVSLVVLSYVGSGRLQDFGFRFTFLYFLLYFFPQPLNQIVPPISMIYEIIIGEILNLTASFFFSVELPPVRPTGSGDTLRDYMRVFLWFVVAIGGAVFWSVLSSRVRLPDWLRNGLRIVLRDGLRTYVRWVLAVTLLNYGLAKLGTFSNQFPEPGVGQLLKPWGESSPMNVVWTFMGTSRTYTNFSGWMEVIAALLLIWRRTATLGGLVAAGVMTNVLMLNLCYDVPVKQYSAHLLLMSIFVVLHDWRALFDLLIRNRSITPAPVGPSYPEPVLLWFHRGFKAFAILLFVVLQAVSHWRMESAVAETGSPASPLLGDFVVESVRSAGDEQNSAEENGRQLSGGDPWRYVSLQRIRSSMFDSNSRTFAIIRTMEGGVTSSAVQVDESAGVITFESGQSPIRFSVESLDDQRMKWTSDSKVLELRRVHREDFLLVNRGFRWISEIPYNR